MKKVGNFPERCSRSTKMKAFTKSLQKKSKNYNFYMINGLVKIIFEKKTSLKSHTLVPMYGI